MTDRPVRREPSPDWWRTFFTPVVGEVMFVPKAGQTEIEVNRVIAQSKARAPAAVLDLACGAGRHALVFAQRGFEVTGLDYAPHYLAQARAAARKRRLDIRLVQGDMRNLKPHFAADEFDLVVSLFNSFGYFQNRREDRSMLQSVERVLRPGGAFVINTLNGAGVARRLKTPVTNGREPLPNVFLLDAARYEPGNKQTVCDWTVVDARRGRARIFRSSYRQDIYSHAQLKRMLADCGFTIERTWGLLRGGRFDPATSWSQTIVARKPA